MPYRQILNHKETVGTGDYEGDITEDLMWYLSLSLQESPLNKNLNNKTKSQKPFIYSFK